jgi:hypothetical protein
MSEYIRNFHRLVGSFPVVECSALTFLTDLQGNLLLIRAPEEPYWKLPGGPLEPDEKLIHCLQRHVMNQTGVFIENGVLLQVFTGSEMSYISVDNANISPVYAAFIPGNVRGTLKRNAEFPMEFRFFASWNIPMTEVFPPMLACMDYYREYFPEGIPLQPLDLDRFAKYE